MDPVRLAIRQPVTIAVGVILVLMAGVLALTRLPIQLTPDVEDTIIAVTTRWEGASPAEIEQEIVDKQEEKLQGVSSLRTMTSNSVQGQGSIRLEFQTGTDKDDALREVSDKLREVEEYPENVDEPVIEASDPESRDYIAWVVFGSTDPSFDVRVMQDFAEDRIKPVLERVAGVSEINVLGGRERETQVRFDPIELAHRGITPSQFVGALRQTNRDVSAGQMPDGRFDVRVRTLSEYTATSDVETTIVGYDASGGPILVRDVASVLETFKESESLVRWKGRPVLAINAQREVGSNVIEVMNGIRAALDKLRIEGGVLENEGTRRGLNGELFLVQVYDQTSYIDQALHLVQSNIWIGGGIAIAILLTFLRSVRPVAIIALAIPISVIGAVVAMLVLGRTVNVVSLAGMAFAVGMVVDNAIVVIENIYRHLEMGKKPMDAAYQGAREVWGALVAATLTTIIVFVPILLVEEEAGQLFRDIALAICAAVGLSLIVSVSVIPSAAARLLKTKAAHPNATASPKRRSRFGRALGVLPAISAAIPRAVSASIYWMLGGWVRRIVVVVVLTAGSIFGAVRLMPPADYLPTGNRNLVFGVLIPPPGYTIEKQSELGQRLEEVIRPFWEAAEYAPGTAERAEAEANLPSVPSGWGGTGPMVTPPPVDNYFFVTRPAMMFHGAISSDDRRVTDVVSLLQAATTPDRVPGVLAFARQIPLFRIGGSSGSALKIDFVGDDLEEVSSSALAVMMKLMGDHPGAVQPNPSNFNLPTPELQVIPDRVRLAEVGLTPEDLGLAVQAFGDGAIIGEYRVGGDSIDLKVIARDSVDRDSFAGLDDTPIATPGGGVVPLWSLAGLSQTTAATQINRVDRRRAVTLEFTPPQGMALEAAISEVEGLIAEDRASGVIPPTVDTQFTGSASKLTTVRNVLLGDGTILGTGTSALFLALVVVYLLMCVLFQSFTTPAVIMVSVPPATLGGFLALYGVHKWSEVDRYLPAQNLDILTMLGFVLLIGVVVNNAILIVHQALNFMAGRSDISEGHHEALAPRDAIAESVRTRVRPILMSTLTSVGGMLPLVLMPGSGSELYRGLGSVVVGGLVVSTVFTLVLAPVLLSLVLDAQALAGRVFRRAAPATPGLGASGAA